MRLRTMQAGPVMQMPVFILLFLAPVYVPLELVGGWVHEVARFNPATAFLEAARGFVSGEPEKISITAACLLGMFALTVLWARGGLRSAERAG
jgi:ABC-2 type transport system permease protein